MRRNELLCVIPIALQELHMKGVDWVFVDVLGQQVTRHDAPRLRRREIARSLLGRVGITIPELPSGMLVPGPAKMYPALSVLERCGVIEGEFAENPPERSDKPRRRAYRLVT